MFDKKRKLVEKVFEKAKNELPKSSKTAIAFYLSALFEEEYGFSKDERTFVRFYKKLVEEELDYNIDLITLDHMSLYLGYENFNEFSKNYRNESITYDYGTLKVSISESSEGEDILSRVVVNITNAPIFTIPEFITKHKNSFGFFSVLIFLGILISPYNFFNKNNQNRIVEVREEIYLDSILNNNTPSNLIINLIKENKPINKRLKCIYWNIDHYEAVYVIK
ncbi:hypothetical protein [Chishuiella sp.]|uniref:hypothetical protein n=1 Tax=Chishuiella sp. TaxID=1969467 RepID=UPI0028A7D7CD|nr:hypothetical protein [Chishuiella sp.]